MKGTEVVSLTKKTLLRSSNVEQAERKTEKCWEASLLHCGDVPEGSEPHSLATRSCTRTEERVHVWGLRSFWWFSHACGRISCCRRSWTKLCASPTPSRTSAMAISSPISSTSRCHLTCSSRTASHEPTPISATEPSITSSATWMLLRSLRLPCLLNVTVIMSESIVKGVTRVFQEEVDAVFVNATLSGIQQRNLEVSVMWFLCHFCFMKVGIEVYVHGRGLGGNPCWTVWDLSLRFSMPMRLPRKRNFRLVIFEVPFFSKWNVVLHCYYILFGIWECRLNSQLCPTRRPDLFVLAALMVATRLVLLGKLKLLAPEGEFISNFSTEGVLPMLSNTIY